MIDTAALFENARSWKGTKFLHQGRSRLGADCLGYVSACLDELGCSVFLDYLPLNYSRTPSDLVERSLEQLTRKIELQPGALIVFQFPLTKHASHAGIFTGATLVHCDQMSGGVVECGYRMPWTGRTRSIWALPGVVYR